MTKAEYHLRMKELSDFSDLLVDICDYVKPVLSVMDGIVGMEATGLLQEIRHIGALLMSPNPYALMWYPLRLWVFRRERCVQYGALKNGVCAAAI